MVLYLILLKRNGNKENKSTLIDEPPMIKPNALIVGVCVSCVFNQREFWIKSRT